MGGCGTKEDAKASVGKKQQRTAVGDKPVKPGKAGRKLAALRLKDELIPEFPPVQRPERRPRKIESLGVRDLELSIRLMNSVAVVQDLEACIECLMRGADPNILDSEGDGPLHHAIVAPEFHTTRGLAVIRHLATEGILEEAPHALMLAAHASRVRAAALLLSLNCPVLGGEVPAAMSHVSEEDDVESFESAEGQQVLNAIIDRCPEAVNEPDDEHGDTPLTLALINGKPACALILLKRKASTTTPDSAKRLPIHNVMALQESDKSVRVFPPILRTWHHG
ncbi:hypothetical protein DIPPA_30582 [Diplonema papillatum]|nr:hypothetical protein DIPPA_30582 [Diplonema papillatum]